MELQHFSDDHPLIFSAVTASGFTCDGCGESIKGSRYSCRKCDFDLHPSCAELPRELQHPIHSKHPLILHKTPPYDGKTCTCSVCNLPCKWFVYNCTHCKFNLDIKCASLRFIPGAETHDHQLTHFGSLSHSLVIFVVKKAWACLTYVASVDFGSTAHVPPYHACSNIFGTSTL